MRNLIGNFLIGFAAFISFMHTMLLFLLIGAIIMGVFITTMIGLFELLAKLTPNPEFQLAIFGKWYWDLIAVVLGGSTMWLGFSKMFEDDKKKNIYFK